MLPSVVVLGGAGAMALFLTLNRGWAKDGRKDERRAVQTALVLILCQAVHFTEELWTGFHVRLPALFGLSAMPRRSFVLFNLTWLVIWAVSALGLAARRRAALFPLWFLGIACVANGVLHPLLSVLSGEYFPGLVTAPVVGVLGVLLLRRLLLITDGVTASARVA